jgi:hypothetical protein
VAGIPPSPYPVLKDSTPPQRILMGPYFASRPAYQMLREGRPISDLIAEDMAAQAKAEGRPNPVIELPENAHYYVGGGGGGDHDAGYINVEPPTPASSAPLAAPGLPVAPGIAPVPAVPPAPLSAPASVAPPAPANPPAAPAPDLESGPLPAAALPGDGARIPVAHHVARPAADVAPAKAAPVPKMPSAAQRMAKASYQRANHAARPPQARVQLPAHRPDAAI